MDGTTLIVPQYGQPNCMATLLYGLIKHSRLKNRIIVVWSDPAYEGGGGARDCMMDYNILINENRAHGYQKYSSVQDYMMRKADFIKENNIEFVEITEQCAAFREEYKAGRIWKGNAVKPAPGIWEGGQDIAFKDNWGVNMAMSEWVMPNIDCDFYFTDGWDEIMLETMDGLGRARTIFVPTQMQPLQFEKMPHWPNIWDDCRVVACARLTMPIPWRSNNAVTEVEIEEFFKKTAQPAMLYEKPGLRDRLHHFPVLYRTEELKKVIGLYNYQGAGYDLEIDDRCGQLGFTKISRRNVWCIHKAMPAIPDELL